VAAFRVTGHVVHIDDLRGVHVCRFLPPNAGGLGETVDAKSRTTRVLRNTG
jgi:hypothetical protein